MFRLRRVIIIYYYYYYYYLLYDYLRTINTVYPLRYYICIFCIRDPICITVYSIPFTVLYMYHLH